MVTIRRIIQVLGGGGLATGTTWVCQFVAPMDLGTIAPTTTRNTTDTDTHEMRDIFDILSYHFTTSANNTQTELYPVKNWEKKGKYTEAWIDPIGFKGQIRIGNKTDIKGNPADLLISRVGTRNNAPVPIRIRNRNSLL